MKKQKEKINLWIISTVILVLLCIALMVNIEMKTGEEYHQQVYNFSKIKISEDNFQIFLDLAKNKSWESFILTSIEDNISVQINLN